MRGTRVRRLLLCLVVSGGLVLGAWTPPPAVGATFTDVPESYWAYEWIECLAALGLVSGYGDGSYRPELPVTRAAMAVYVGRTLQVTSPAAGFGVVSAPDSGEPYSLLVAAPPALGATEYRLYRSTDGVNFTLATEATLEGQMIGFIFWRLTVPEGTIGIYFKPMAVVNGVERQLTSHLLMARPTQVAPGITVTEPTGSDVSLQPRLMWNSVPGAVAYTAAIVAHHPDHQDAYTVLVDSSRTSVGFGETVGPGVLGGLVQEQLVPSTTYDALVRAVDASGWSFASSGNQAFTTGP